MRQIDLVGLQHFTFGISSTTGNAVLVAATTGMMYPLSVTGKNFDLPTSAQLGGRIRSEEDDATTGASKGVRSSWSIGEDVGDRLAPVA